MTLTNATAVTVAYKIKNETKKTYTTAKDRYTRASYSAALRTSPNE